MRPAKWLHNDVPVDMITIDTRTEMSGTGHRYIGDSSTAALHIDSARLEDDGIWKCTIENDHDELLFGRTVKLVILEAPRGTYLLIDGRRLDPGNQFVPVKEGSELTLECAAEGGNPPSVLSWGMTLSQTTSEGPEQPPDNLTVVPSTRAGHSGAHLKVQRGHHNATIICTARHVTLNVPMNASILLDVQYTPSFAITRLPGFGNPIFEGMAVSLKCDVDSNPSSLPIWQCDNEAPPVEQSDDGWLNYTKISRNDSGWYKCYTRHTLGVFSSIGYFLVVRGRPMVNPTMQSVSAKEGDALEVAVEFCAEPSYTKLLWLSSESVYVPGGNARDDVRVLEVENGEINACFKTTLQIDAVQLSHSGEWMLIVRSPAGVADASVSVSVTRTSSFSGDCISNSNIATLFLCLVFITLYPQQR
ncbi:GSCOCG00009867001-RA-CDS [Cotesia congregata]|nr:GSCOCG00009867001-RA-CDS [Cotesia congregata]